MGIVSSRLIGKTLAAQSDRQWHQAVLRAFRSLLKQPAVTAPSPTRLVTALDAAVIDHYVRRNKSSRNYPRKKSDPPCGPPQIQTATRRQKQIAKRLKRTKSGLTA